MNLKETLAKLDAALAPQQPAIKTQKMTAPQFEAYVVDQLAKAKEDMADKDKGAEKAKKRLEHLRGVLKLLVAKAEGPAASNSASASGGENGLTIPVYEEGFEPPTYMPTEEGGDMLGGKGTQADGQSYAAAGGAAGYNDAKGTSGAPSGTTVPASGTGTQADATIFANAGALNKAMEGLVSTLKELQPAAKKDEEDEDAQKRAAAEKGLPDDPSVWPSDMATKDFLKEGVAKRAEEWGTDPWAAVK